jgi:hypothetical protein
VITKSGKDVTKYFKKGFEWRRYLK